MGKARPCDVWDEIEVDEDATEEEITEMVKEAVYERLEYSFEEVI